MNLNYTDITFLLDRSGSMGKIKKDVTDGFNSFIKEQRKLSDKCTISRIQFDDTYAFDYMAKNINDKDVLFKKDEFRPRGWTALLDALGRAIKETGERYSNMREEDRPGRVLFVVYTDGQENCSKEYSASTVMKMIETQQKIYSWDFVFLGANQDSFLTAKGLGFQNLNAVANYEANSLGVMESFASLNAGTQSFRSASSKAYVERPAGSRFTFEKK